MNKLACFPLYVHKEGSAKYLPVRFIPRKCKVIRHIGIYIGILYYNIQIELGHSLTVQEVWSES